MAFRFPLQAVLHYRQSLEHQQELRLRTANQQVARVRRMLDQHAARMQALHAGQARDLAAGTTAAELRFAALCESALEQQRQELERELQRLQVLRDEQQKLFVQARRQRETLAGLRDRQRLEYERTAARREQRQLDDTFLLRRAYLDRSQEHS
ncbi:MAG TPA: flagellar export protein FliJ [Terriglobales bacterium]|nr:flagellar export protein FliJ [Terriglobales bacterium]